jgi:heme/copper-type cytochrome/quinol oxidase subunit 4
MILWNEVNPTLSDKAVMLTIAFILCIPVTVFVFLGPMQEKDSIPISVTLCMVFEIIITVIIVRLYFLHT